MKKRSIILAATGAILLAGSVAVLVAQPWKASPSTSHAQAAPSPNSHPQTEPPVDWSDVQDPVARAIFWHSERWDSWREQHEFYKKHKEECDQAPDVFWNALNEPDEFPTLDQLASRSEKLTPSRTLAGLSRLYGSLDTETFFSDKPGIAERYPKAAKNLGPLLIASLDNGALENRARLGAARALASRVLDATGREAVLSREKALNNLGPDNPGSDLRKKIESAYFIYADYQVEFSASRDQYENLKKEAFDRWISDSKAIQKADQSLKNAIESLRNATVVGKTTHGIVGRPSSFYQLKGIFLSKGNQKLYEALLDSPSPALSCMGYCCLFETEGADPEELVRRAKGDYRIVERGGGCVVSPMAVETAVEEMSRSPKNWPLF